MKQRILLLRGRYNCGRVSGKLRDQQYSDQLLKQGEDEQSTHAHKGRQGRADLVPTKGGEGEGNERDGSAVKNEHDLGDGSMRRT
jgi:hypothetical protein